MRPRLAAVLAAALMTGAAATAATHPGAHAGWLAETPFQQNGADGSTTPNLRNPDVVRELLAARVGTSLGPPGGEVRGLVMAPSESSRLYLGTADGHIFVSDTAAASWRGAPTGLPHDAVIDNLVVHPANADVAYAAFWRGDREGGLLRTDDGGETWRRLPVPGDPSLKALALAPSAPATVYVGGIGGVWRSDDGGSAWRFAAGEGLPFHFVESLAVDPRDPDRVYAGTWRQAYRTLDGGTTWHRIHNGMAIDRDVFSVIIDPRDPDQLLAGTCNFIYVSSTGGDSWSERRKGLAADHNRVHVVAHHPVDPELLFAGTRGALYRSNDGGANWVIALAGVSVSSIEVDPSGSPVYVGTEERGVLVSHDGLLFEEANDGLTASRVVAFDALPGAPRVLFAARSEGPTRDTVFFSTDVGSSWEPLGNPPVLGRIHRIRAQLEPENRVLIAADHGWWSVEPGGAWYPADPPPGTVNALEIAHEAGGEVIAATDRGLFVAQPGDLGVTDNTASGWGPGTNAIWKPLYDGGEVVALAIDGRRLMAAGSGKILRGTPAAVEVIDSEGLPGRLAGIALGTEGSGVAYAVADDRVFRTADSGVRWETLPLPWPAADLREVAIDPANPEQVLALDYRGGLYRGHGEGRYWLILDDDPGLHRAWKLRVSAQAAGLALVATQGHGLRVVALGGNLDSGPTPDAVH